MKNPSNIHKNKYKINVPGASVFDPGLFSKPESKNETIIAIGHEDLCKEKGSFPLFLKKKTVHNQFLQFLKSSSHFGRKSRHLDFAFPWHASMCNKFSGVRNKVPHINAQQSLQSLVEAFYCVALVLRKGGKVLVVNKNSEFSPLFYPHSGDVFSLEKRRSFSFEKKERSAFLFSKEKTHHFCKKEKDAQSHSFTRVESPSFFDQKETRKVDGLFGVFSLEKTNKPVFYKIKNTTPHFDTAKQKTKQDKSPFFKNSLHSVSSIDLASERKVKYAPAIAPLKWVGGCLTNWKEISKSVATFLYFSKRFGKFIKQNNIHFPRFKKMKNSFQGFINIEREQLLLKEKPQLLFLFNADESQQILDEAIALQIPVIALTDSSTDLSQITYPIPINSDSTHLVYWCLSQLMQITERQGGLLE